FRQRGHRAAQAPKLDGFGTLDDPRLEVCKQDGRIVRIEWRVAHRGFSSSLARARRISSWICWPARRDSATIHAPPPSNRSVPPIVREIVSHASASPTERYSTMDRDVATKATTAAYRSVIERSAYRARAA